MLLDGLLVGDAVGVLDCKKEGLVVGKLVGWVEGELFDGVPLGNVVGLFDG